MIPFFCVCIKDIGQPKLAYQKEGWYKVPSPHFIESWNETDQLNIYITLYQKKHETQTSEEKTFFLNTLVEKFELHQVTQGKDGLDFETTVAQALIFLLAGFDTTANLLMWTSYYLAMHPDLQDQVYEEITSHAGLKGEEANYETVNKMQLLG